MATYQDTYSTRRGVGLPGMVASEEKSNRISRTVESSAGLEFGQPAFRGVHEHGALPGGSFSGEAEGTAAAGNTGDGTITAAPAVSGGAKQGRYTVTIVESASDAGEFVVEDPDGITVGTGTVAVPFTGGGLSFTVSDGSTDFVAGDQFYIDVEFTSNAEFLGIAILSPAVPADPTTPDRYPENYTAAIMTMGVIYVTAGASVSPGASVYWNPSTKRYTSDSAHIRVPGATFETAGGDGDLVEVALGGIR